MRSRLTALWSLHASPAAIWQANAARRPKKGGKPDPAAKRRQREGLRRVRLEAVEARLLRELVSPSQLQELMVAFWYNHFNVFSGKGLDRFWFGAYEEQAIRPHALGRFRDLLGATAKHPAMLFYLDNWRSSAPRSTAVKGRFKGLNENYAREVMELHTLGVDGGYTQSDVTNLARILTGWGFSRPGFAYRFSPKRHDRGEKVFLGRRFEGGTEAEGEAALDMLASSPATARHLSYQLAQYFVADEPPASLVDRLAARWQATDGDIRQVLDALFHSPAFWRADVRQAKFKAPDRYMISALRAAGAEDVDARAAYRALKQAGMAPYGCPTPNGYACTRRAWLSPDAMTRRVSWAIALGAGRANVAPDLEGPLDARAIAAALGGALTADTRAAVAREPATLGAALLLGSPDFMRY